VRIVPASLGMHARIALQSSSLGRAARHLSREHIKTKKADETLSFSDPDGNEITVQLR